MYTLEAIKTNIARLISETLEIEISAEEIVSPPKAEMGDLAFGCFKLAKTQKVPPHEAAVSLADKLRGKDTLFLKVEAEGSYTNFTLKPDLFTHRIVKEVLLHGEKYGHEMMPGKKKVMVEYANLNSHKEFHVGHLRNIFYGHAICKLLEAYGDEVVPVSYINDMGANVAKCVWIFTRKGLAKLKNTTVDAPELSAELKSLNITQAKSLLEMVPADLRTGKYLGEIYAESTRLLESRPELSDEISFVHAKIEEHDPAWYDLWQETRRWSLLELFRYLQDFGVTIKRQYLESEFLEESRHVVDELQKDGLAVESQGAIIVDLENVKDPEIAAQKLPVFMIRKSDGNLLYASKDIPLAQKKLEEFPDMMESLIVVDVRQSLYFKQLFATLKLMGIKVPFKHLGYEFVTLPEGAMSSRKGTVVTLQDFLGQAVDLARQEVVNRHGESWNDGKIEHSAWSIAFGGVIFTILKQDPEKTIVFDIKKALAFEGDTGPYVQYSITRLNSILNKAGGIIAKEIPIEGLTHDAEKQLAMVLAKLPSAIKKSAEDYKPSMIAQWCLEAAGAVNAFYRDVTVLDEPDEKIKQARLALVGAAKKAMMNAMDLLSIPVPDAM